MSRLRVNEVSKSFSSPSGARRVLRGVSLDVAHGGLLCLLGPNGSGKTTLLKTISTLLIPETGSVFVDDVDVHRHTERAKRKIGFASTEDQSFYGRLSARMNLWFYAQMYGLGEGAFEDRLRDLADLLDLRGGLDRPYRELSSGQKQRFLLARADLHDPAVLVLDEPHQNLDPAASVRLRRILQEVWVGKRGKTVIVSTHHLEDAQKISDQWVVLVDGETRFSGSLAQARAVAPHHDLESFFHRLTSPSGSEPGDGFNLARP